MLVGHQKQWLLLKKMVELGKVPHALLFCGQEKLGKKTIALEFFKFLNCENENLKKKPCQLCKSCKLLQKGTHPDFLIVEPENQEIRISQIRELEQKLFLTSHSAIFKMAIIDEAHTMNKEAQTAFLKTLEEPKGKSIFILITEYPETLLSTITSRCEILRFSPVKITEIKNFLHLQGISEKKAQELAMLSFGSPGRAIEFFKNPKKLEFQQQILKEISKLIRSDLSLRFSYAKKLTERPQDLREILGIWLNYFREILLKRKFLAINYSESKIRRILKLIQTVNFLILTTNINKRLALEMLMLEL